LLGFLSLKPGDTDREYFDDYTQEQLDFVAEFGDSLAMTAARLRDDEE
jgi:hypothetical protein